MSERASSHDAVELLAQLCERYDELPPSQHTAVMEAFNLCADSSPTPSSAREAVSTRSVGQLLRQAHEALGIAADDCKVVREGLTFRMAQRLIVEAASRL